MPVVFAVERDIVVSAVDDKPKRSPRLQRLANVRAEPRASLLVDHYADDWRALWWVRADGPAEVIAEGPERDRALGLLADKYVRYRRRPPTGPAIVVRVTAWRWWAAR